MKLRLTSAATCPKGPETGLAQGSATERAGSNPAPCAKFFNDMKDGIYELSQVHLRAGVLAQFKKVVQRASPEIDRKYPEVSEKKSQDPKVRVLNGSAHLFIKVRTMQVRMPLGPEGTKWKAK